MSTTTVTLTYHQQILKNKDEQHQKEIRTLENKIQRFKQAADDRRKELFEELNRGDRLSKSLGFTSIHDAQCAIDTVDSELSFVECYNQLHVLETQVDAAQKEKDIWRLQSSQLEEENSTLLSQIKELRQLKDRLSTELEDLRKRYDDLESVKKRALERYKADYAKWSTFAAWLVKPDHSWNEEGITPAEKKKRGIVQKREMFLKMGPNLSNLPFDETLEPPPPLGGTKVIEEEDITPKRKRLDSDITGAQEIPKSVLRPIDNIPPPSSVPPKLSADCHDLVCPPSTTAQVKEEPMSSPISHSRSQKKPDRALCSSDTEDDSQGISDLSLGFYSGPLTIFQPFS
ncbi:hypothetical protein BJ165DRAFT_186316 [Panaeolus papilionaceus]|nr:hypothetical protein BJ165DRAFT_186316 [Panaeolus papilionaceus]